MTTARIVHERVTRANFLDILLVGKTELARDDVIELHALVIREVDGLVLLLFKIRSGDYERLGKFVAQVRSLVQVLEARTALDGQSIARPYMCCEFGDPPDAAL